MITYEEEQLRQQAQRDYQTFIGNKRAIVSKISILLFDKKHTPMESLQMRLEAIAGIQLEEKVPNQTLQLVSDHLAALSTVGTEKEQQAYLELEKRMLDQRRHLWRLLT
ncbi:hypothetical protein HBP98_17160 [Listeria booriae]|uniref:Uncharacterized protein n=1 Tax=Listeria booriae TaxID=1552123 RepID=A0A7X1BW95_9LIST|nr:hypothetical protein [Listeria booriae]MBC1333547.1 hypothetical protein [Listeria booriae]MBC2373743.1 hypothetical protein [Listeria booriae]